MSQTSRVGQSLAPGDRVSVYRLVRQVGEGGMGFIWEAEHTELGRRCALKIMRQDQISEGAIVRFLREARISAQLDQPHAVSVYDSGVHEGVPYIVMELLEGDTLAERLEYEEQLEQWEIVSIGLALADVLSQAHQIGILHRDIKPSNVMLVRGSAGELHPKLLDFGISLLRDPWPEALQRRITDSRVLLGTPHYMAPERCRNFREASAATDVYALGVMLYECAAGRLPVDSDSFWEVIDHTIRGVVPPLSELRPDLPRRFCEVIHRCIAVDTAHRFSNMNEVGAALLPHGRADISERWRLRFAGRKSEPYLRYRPARNTWRPRVSTRVRARSRVWAPAAVFVTAAVALGLWWGGAVLEPTPATPAAEAPAPQELSLGYVGPLGALDWYDSIAAPVADASRALVERLSYKAPDGSYASDLVTVAPGMRSNRPAITLVGGVRFPSHPCFPEGRALVPEDVAYSIVVAHERGWASLPLRTPDAPAESVIVRPQDGAIVLDLAHNVPDIPSHLSQVFLIPHEMQTCEALSTRPVGTGAYQLAAAANADGAVMVPNPGARVIAGVDRLVWRASPSVLDGLSDVRTGRLDALLLYPRDEGFASFFEVGAAGRVDLAPALRMEGVQVGAEVREAYALRVVMQMPREGPFADPILRRSLYAALDLDALARVGRHGVTTAWPRFLVPGVSGYDAGANLDRGDRPEARAGFRERQRRRARRLPRLMIGVTSTSVDYGRALVEQLRSFGIEAESRVLELSELSDARESRPEMAFLLGQQWRARDGQLRVLSMIDVESEFATAVEDVGASERDTFYQTWERDMLQRLPYLPIAANERVVPYRIVAYGPRVGGVFDPVTGRRRTEGGHWVQALSVVER